MDEKEYQPGVWYDYDETSLDFRFHHLERVLYAVKKEVGWKFVCHPMKGMEYWMLIPEPPKE